MRPSLRLFSTLAVLLASSLRASGPDLSKVHPWILERTQGDDTAELLIVLASQADLSPAAGLRTRAEKAPFVRDALFSVASASQGPLLDLLRRRGAPHRPFYIVNAIWVRAGRDLVLELASRSDVLRLDANPVIANPPARPLPDGGVVPFTVGSNIDYTGAPLVWAMGFTGQGIVLGGQDTGYQWDHPALKPHYRGWNGAIASHDFNWHDSIHSGGGSCGVNSPFPCDDDAHGTHTMGTAVGDDGVGNQIGMAPGARWIGCRNMDQGNGTPATYLECLEFFLAPYPVGGTPAQGDPLMAPDVTNNSWGCPPSEGCSPNTLLAAMEAQRAAGIMTVVSAGNEGSSCSSVGDPPGIYDAVYSVGALTTGTDGIASFSSRGPVTVDGSNRLKPDISAPGTNVRSSVPGGGYQGAGWSGTSMAGPHVAGAVALIWSAIPGLRNDVTGTEALLNATAFPISSTACSSNGVPNNTYGWGRLDVKAAVDRCLTPLVPGSNGPICAGVTLELTAPSIPGATYAWTGPNGFSSAQQNPTIPGATVAASGTYTVSVTGGGCLPPAGNVNVTVNAAPGTPTATASDPVCTGDTLQLSTPDVPGATYAWTGPNGFSSSSRTPSIPNVTTAASGTYSVTLSVGGGCSSPAGTVNVTVGTRPPSPNATGPGAVCAGGTIQLSCASIVGASYSWTGPNGFTSNVQSPSIPNATAAATGTYTVSASVAGCVSPPSPVSSTTVTVKPVPSTPAASSNGPLCEGQTVQLSASTIPGATYAWTGPNGFSSAQQNPSIAGATPAASGAYSVAATVNGCTSPAGGTTVTVSPLPAAPTASGGGSLCAGGTLQLQASTVVGASYSWTGPNGFSSTSQSPSIPNATPAATGTYSVTATVGGCTSAPASVAATVMPVPSTPAPQSNGPLCPGQTLVLTGPTVPGATYAWAGPNGFASTAQSPSIPSVSAAHAGSYSLVVTVNGCASEAGTTNVAVSSTPATPTATANGPLCTGDTLLLSASPVAGATYAWSGPNGFSSTAQSPSIPSVTLAAAGTYTVTASVNGCGSAASSVTVAVGFGDATPQVQPPAPITLVQSACQGSQAGVTLDSLASRDPAGHAALVAFLSGGTATDDCGNPTALPALFDGASVVGSTFLPAGNDLVTFSFADGGGRTGFASGLVTVTRQGDADADGVTNIFDSILIQNLVVGNLAAGVPPFNASLRVADADGNGIIDIFDVIVHQAFLVGNLTCLVLPM